MVNKLVILDRDGVINRDAPEGILALETFVFLPRAIDAMVMLSQAGYQLAICTNQSAVGRGRLSPATLEAIHHHLQQTVINAGGTAPRIYVAPDLPEAPTERRKPGAGMLREALADAGAHAADTFMIGDMLRDLQAAHAAGCKKILVRTGKGAHTEANGIPEALQPVHICDELFAAAAYILAH